MNQFFKADFVPFSVFRECMSEEEAKDCITLLQNICDHLAKTYPVYMRQAPQYSVDRFIDMDQAWYRVSARVVVGPPEAGAGYR